jgi:nucleoside 2-deoxyribosyltransferase
LRSARSARLFSRAAVTTMSPTLKPQKNSHSVYFGGPLFDLKHLVGNAYLAESIFEKSHGRYLCHLPQDFELRGLRPQIIRDQDIRALYAADLALFNFDGTELDSGTVVEFMLAKFADIPSVVLRTDLRGAGDQGSHARDPWNLMVSFYPRTVTVRADSLIEYRTLLKTRLHRVRDDMVRLAGQHASATAAIVCDRLAVQVVRAFERVRKLPPQMPKHLREEVYQWLALMPGLRGKQKSLRKELEEHLVRKVKKDLL